ncbi:MAG: hypothetical protein GPJ54_04990 [Candidatus Heimdallarchaeota archaeon]|nr:hypothetical protein [Candidatus Heimdallarchaeota archaeon]
MLDEIEHSIEILRNEGKYLDILHLMDKLPQEDEKMLLEKVRTYRQLGEYEAALEIIDSLANSEDSLIQIHSLREKSHILCRQSKLSLAEEILNNCKDVLEQTTLRHFETMLVNAEILHTEGNINGSSGRLSKALVYYKKSLKLYLDINHVHEIPAIKMNIGIVYSFQGLVDQALEYFFNALEAYVILNNIQYKSLAISNIGDQFWKKGDTTAAIHYTSQTLKILQSTGNSSLLAETLSSLITYHLEINDKNSAETYYRKLSELENSTNDPFIRNLQMINNSRILKSEGRLNELCRAQDILYELATRKNIDINLLHNVVMALCEILILELKASNDELLLNEITDLITQLHQAAKDSNSRFLEVQTMIIIANLTVVQGELFLAKRRFEEVIELANEREYFLLKEKATRQYQNLLDEFHKWENLSRNNSTIVDLIHQVEAEDYLNFIVRYGKI